MRVSFFLSNCEIPYEFVVHDHFPNPERNTCADKILRAFFNRCFFHDPVSEIPHRQSLSSNYLAAALTDIQ